MSLDLGSRCSDIITIMQVLYYAIVMCHSIISTKDGLVTTCSHIPLARRHLQHLVLHDPSTVDPLADNAPNELGESCFI